MNAVAEMARGATAPSVLPVWSRELLNARNPARVTFEHHEYDDEPDAQNTSPPDDIAHRLFFFGPREISALKMRLPEHIRKTSSTFEILTACLWRCRTIALQLRPEEEVRIICVVNIRGKQENFLPLGYYGNAFTCPAAVSKVKSLCGNPLEYALDLVKKAKSQGIRREYLQSVADLMVLRGRPRRPHLTIARSYVVSDLTRVGFENVDFGWGKAMYGGPATGGDEDVPLIMSFYISFMNGIVVPVCLPSNAMDRFVKEIESITSENHITAPPS